MAVAAPARAIHAPSHRTSWAWIFIAVLVIGAIAWRVLDETTLTEQRDALVAADAYGLHGGPDFLRWKTAPITSGQADITAVYTGQSGFDIHVFTNSQHAQADFETHLNAYEHWPEVQEINTFADSERCFLARERYFCFGFDGNRAFSSHTLERSDPDGLDALLLLRTARKHWYRFFNQ